MTDEVKHKTENYWNYPIEVSDINPSERKREKDASEQMVEA